MASHSAFDGQVTFECGYRTLKAIIVEEAFELAVPEHVDFAVKSQRAIAFNNLKAFFGVTASIAFALDENPLLDLAAFRDWWLFAQSSDDYRAIWERYLEAATSGISNEWGKAYSKGQSARLHAPVALQVPPEVAATDPSSQATTSD